MKHLSLLLFSLVCYTMPIYAQDFWEQLNFPDSLEITCMAVNAQSDIFVGTNTNYAYDGIFRSQDEGQSWELVLDMGLYGPISLTLNDAGYMYALGGIPGWYLLKSIDNGLTWTSLPLPEYGSNVKIVSQGTDTLYVSQWADNGAVLLRSINGGAEWEELFATTGYPGEYISDIEISNTGIIYISLSCFFQDMGGVFRSIDNGQNWEYVGLLNHQIKGMAINLNDDVFTLDWYTMNDDEIPGIYALYQGATEFELKRYVIYGSDIVIDSEDHIYAAANESVLQSDDNGETFEYIDEPLSQFIQILQLDDSGYIYGAIHSRLVRSIYPTITSINAKDNTNTSKLHLSPNPVNDIININLLPGLANSQRITIGIYDQYGKQCINRTINTIDNHIQIDVSCLKQGMYFIGILYDNTLLNSKFIKN
jgi:hypothetical protein